LGQVLNAKEPKRAGGRDSDLESRKNSSKKALKQYSFESLTKTVA